MTSRWLALLVSAAAMLCAVRPVSAQYALPGALQPVEQGPFAPTEQRVVPRSSAIVPLLTDSIPYRSRRKYVITGTLIGLSAGLTVGLIARGRDGCDCFPGNNIITVSGALIGAGVGALGGLLIHTMIKTADRQRAEASRPKGSPTS